jgi:hypothetical protein
MMRSYFALLFRVTLLAPASAQAARQKWPSTANGLVEPFRCLLYYLACSFVGPQP